MSNFKLLMIMKNLSLKEMRKVAVMFVLFVSVAIASMSAISEKQSAAQQVAVGCGYVAGETEGGASGAWNTAADALGATAAGMAINGAYHAYATTTNPVGWGYWAVTACVGL